MKSKKHLWTLYLIIATIVISIITQVYFNYKNYQKNKLQFINDVQISLDNAVDNYFAELAKKEFFITNNNSKIHKKISVKFNNMIDSLGTLSEMYFNDSDLLVLEKKIGSLPPKVTQKKTKASFSFDEKQIKDISIVKDSLSTIQGLTSIFISITKDNINIQELEKLINIELQRKQIKLPFIINHLIDNELFKTNDSISNYKNSIKTFTKSTYLKENEIIELEFPNQTKAYLKKGLLGILLSLILSVAIIISLFYLLYIIKKQKEIAAIKNDFISNITHEFKTPITTIGLVTESIAEFNKVNNQKKTAEYLEITKIQLSKLNVMVEKILETSIIDNDKLLLKKELTDIISILEKSIQKYFISNIEISFKTNVDFLELYVDAFHFRNSINNLIDNAIKYGGDIIKVNLKLIENAIEISIADNGRIDKQYKNKLFDKFYRIPQGNTHDVKGFGIGLYYTKNIIEKHQGSIELLDTVNTIFKITLKNE